MRHCCILNAHSAGNVDLHRLTLLNHADYADAHHYDFINLMEPWASTTFGLLPYLLDLVRRYELVFNIGSDVIFANQPIGLETFIDPGYGVIMSAEDLGVNGSPINNDTVLYQAGSKAEWYLNHLASVESQYRDHPRLLQQATVDLLAADPGIVKILPCRQMQSVPFLQSSGKYQPGDFIIHFLAMGTEERYAACRRFLETGDVLWADRGCC